MSFDVYWWGFIVLDFLKWLTDGFNNIALLTYIIRNYDYILANGKAPSKNIYYNSNHINDIKTSVLYVNNKPNLITLDYFMDVDKKDADSNQFRWPQQRKKKYWSTENIIADSPTILTLWKTSQLYSRTHLERMQSIPCLQISSHSKMNQSQAFISMLLKSQCKIIRIITINVRNKCNKCWLTFIWSHFVSLVPATI